ncbi:precorrin-3B synthase [Actinoplanes sp. NPDC024001]|uniref:precorrin-3B synthase n=1 Tax=Actinoplanes sp. NPDC024001 TaxID=3154598 RepID=UPI0033D7DE96
MTSPRTADVDACPGALRLHAAADGLLARVRLPGGMLSGAQLRDLRELTERFGDGRLELTSRANLQIRAVRAEHAETLAAGLRSAGLLPSITHDNVRNIACPPLAGAALRSLVTGLDAAICGDPELARLPGKFLFAVGHVPLAADVSAVPVEEGFAVRFAGHDTGLRVGAEQVVPVLIAAAHAFLTERSEQRGGGPAVWRLRELADGPARVSARVAAALGLVPVGIPSAAPVPVTEPGDLLGILEQPDQAVPAQPGKDVRERADGRFAVGALVPLGQLTDVPMRVLTEAGRLVVTPWRGVIVPDLPRAAAVEWAERLAAAGLPTATASPWVGVTACAGRPGCAKSLADVRADAAAATRFVAGLPVHWVGCGRACGSPAGRHVRVEATSDGYQVSRHPVPGRPPADPAPAGATPPGTASQAEPTGASAQAAPGSAGGATVAAPAGAAMARPAPAESDQTFVGGIPPGRPKTGGVVCGETAPCGNVPGGEPAQRSGAGGTERWRELADLVAAARRP